MFQVTDTYSEMVFGKRGLHTVHPDQPIPITQIPSIGGNRISYRHSLCNIAHSILVPLTSMINGTFPLIISGVHWSIIVTLSRDSHQAHILVFHSTLGHKYLVASLQPLIGREHTPTIRPVFTARSGSGKHSTTEL